MTESKLKSLITQAVALDREIAEKSDELKELKAALITEAEHREEEHTDTEGGGKCWAATDDEGCLARVSFPARSLKSKIDGEGKSIKKIRSAAGKAFDRLFQPALAYRPVEEFRTAAEAELGRGAGKLIRLCETDSSPRVSFETKETSE